MAIRTHHLRFVNFETWLEFQGVHPEDTRHAAEISWQRMISDGEVSRLYDVMGEVYLGLSIQTLRRCMPADSLAALLLDWYSEGPDPHMCLGGRRTIMTHLPAPVVCLRRHPVSKATFRHHHHPPSGAHHRRSRSMPSSIWRQYA